MFQSFHLFGLTVAITVDSSYTNHHVIKSSLNDEDFREVQKLYQTKNADNHGLPASG